MATPDREMDSSFMWNVNAVDEVLNMLLGGDSSTVLNPTSHATSSKQNEMHGAEMDPAATSSGLQTMSASQNTNTASAMHRQPSATHPPDTLSASSNIRESQPDSSQSLPLMAAALPRDRSQLMDSTLSTVPAHDPQEGMSWQEFVSGIRNEQTTVPPVKKTRGRKPTKTTATKGNKDRKKENSMKIKELEAELQTKLSLVTQLEGQNDELRRRERLLQFSVDASEYNLSKLANHQLPPTLRELLMSFRNTYNKANAEHILSQVSNIKQPQDMTMDIFRSTWQALIMEFSDALMKDSLATTPEAKVESEAHLSRITMQTINFVSALCVHGTNIVGRAQSTSMLTGEEVTTDVNLWAGIADQLALSDEQIKDMMGAWGMYTRALKQSADERSELKMQLDQEVGKRDEDYSCPGGGAVSESISSVMKKITANLHRIGILHTVMAFVVLRIMTPRQVAQLCMHSSPLFPNVIAVLQGLATRLGFETTHNMVPFTNPTSHFRSSFVQQTA